MDPERTKPLSAGTIECWDHCVLGPLSAGTIALSPVHCFETFASMPYKSPVHSRLRFLFGT